MRRPTSPSSPARVNTRGAAARINQLAAELGSPRRVTPATVRDWRTDRKGPAYHKVSGYFVEYDVEEIDRWVREQYSLQAFPGRRLSAVAV